MDIMRNQTFIIQPHFRLQEWVAEEKGVKVGAYRSFEEGRKSDVSCACHWTVNVAATSGHGKLYADLYSVAPAGIFVPADSKVRTPEDLARVPLSVAFFSYTTLA